MEETKVPARFYERPSAKEILDFAASSPTRENIESFILEFGYLKRICDQVDIEGVSPFVWREGKPEGIDLWTREWMDMRLAERMYGAIQDNGTEEARKIIARDATGEYEVYFSERDECGNPMSASIGYGRAEPDIMDAVERGNTKDLLRMLAAKLTAKKLTENPPSIRSARCGCGVVESRETTLLTHIWETFSLLLSGEFEAKRCCVCGVWEMRGEGWVRNTWIQHRSCGNSKRSRLFRRYNGEDETESND